MHKSGSATGDHYTYREEQTLARFTERGLLRYKDLGAYLCRACRKVFNVTCPKCRTVSAKEHGQQADEVFRRYSDDYDQFDGHTWAKIECRKCDFRFRVILL